MTKISYIRGIKPAQFQNPNPERLDLLDYSQTKTQREPLPGTMQNSVLPVAVLIGIFYFILK